MSGRIRVTFYTESDDFSYEQSVDDARDWLETRGKTQSFIRTPDGRGALGTHLDELEDAEIPNWYAPVSLAEVMRKADAGRLVNLRSRQGEVIAIRADRVEAVGVEYIEDDEAEPGSDEWLSQLLEDVDFDPLLD